MFSTRTLAAQLAPRISSWHKLHPSLRSGPAAPSVRWRALPQRELTFTVTEDDETATAADREKAAAMQRLREFRLVFHGLRKNAVNMLLEAVRTRRSPRSSR